MFVQIYTYRMTSHSIQPVRSGDADMPDGSKKVEVVYVRPHELRIEKKLQHPTVDKKSATALDSLTLALAWGVKKR
jgi:hypothetical protein